MCDYGLLAGHDSALLPAITDVKYRMIQGRLELTLEPWSIGSTPIVRLSRMVLPEI